MFGRELPKVFALLVNCLFLCPLESLTVFHVSLQLCRRPTPYFQQLQTPVGGVRSSHLHGVFQRGLFKQEGFFWLVEHGSIHDVDYHQDVNITSEMIKLMSYPRSTLNLILLIIITRDD